MTGAARHQPERRLSVEEFLAADPSEFGSAWLYELIDGIPVAQASPSDDHGAIMSNLATRLTLALEGNPDCRAETTTAAVPRNRSRATARIPDVLVRCGGKPVVVFEVVSPSEERSQRRRDEKRRDLMDVDGVREIVEVVQDEFVCHVYRKAGDLWAFEAVDGPDAVLRLDSIGVEVALASVYAKVLQAGEPSDAGGREAAGSAHGEGAG